MHLVVLSPFQNSRDVCIYCTFLLDVAIVYSELLNRA